MIKKILAAIAKFLRTAGRLTWNATKKTFEWTAERIEAVWDAATDTFDAAIHAPGGLLRKLTGGSGGSGPAVQDPGQAPAPSQQRQEAKQAVQKTSATLDEASAIRSAARALIRGEQPHGIAQPHQMWLRSLKPTELADLCVLKLDEIARVLHGADVKGVAGFELDSWAKQSMIANLEADIVAQRLTQPGREPMFTNMTDKPRARFEMPTDNDFRNNVRDLGERLKAKGYRPVRGTPATERKVS